MSCKRKLEVSGIGAGRKKRKGNQWPRRSDARWWLSGIEEKSRGNTVYIELWASSDSIAQGWQKFTAWSHDRFVVNLQWRPASLL